MCDPLEASCIDDGREIYVRDSDVMYCGDGAVECGCSREYLNCMIKAGCANQGTESYNEYVQECILTGCSPKQCGLAPGTDVCNVSTPMCVNQYFRCNLQVGSQAFGRGFLKWRARRRHTFVPALREVCVGASMHRLSD